MNGTGAALLNASDARFAQAIQRIRALKADMSDERPRHVCAAALCNPQNEPALYTATALTSNVYVCRWGAVHLCSDECCELWRDNAPSHACPISGAQWGGGVVTSSYDAGDSRTWYAKVDPVSVSGPAGPRPKKHFRQRVVDEETLRARAGAMVTLLLYSNRRTRCNDAAIALQQKEAAAALATYRKLCAEAGVWPHSTTMYSIYARNTSKPLPYVMYEFDANLHAYYVGICCQAWHMALRYYVPAARKRYDALTELAPRIDFEDLCLGVLYAMRHGFIVAGVMLLPRDDFLLINMPLHSHMATFGINKHQATEGERILTISYANAIAAHVDPRDLAIDVALLPAQQESGKKVVGSEKLFMPTSRVTRK